MVGLDVEVKVDGKFILPFGMENAVIVKKNIY